MKTEQEKCLNACRELARLVFKEVNGRPNHHYTNIVKKLHRNKIYDTGVQILDEVGAIVQVGLDTKGNLTQDMLDSLVARLTTLIQLMS